MRIKRFLHVLPITGYENDNALSIFIIFLFFPDASGGLYAGHPVIKQNIKEYDVILHSRFQQFLTRCKCGDIGIRLILLYQLHDILSDHTLIFTDCHPHNPSHHCCLPLSASSDRPSTISMIISPGNTAYHGAEKRYVCDSDNMLPRLALGGCTPMPR